ncbi:hypothetical protein [Bradyrhizobium sp. AZCC 2230]|uniref:hypothetical protein n=1 Tax=Bradyrhizobium sp. AZCC 2230 TaxID=3117021 RepID=UPI002FF3EBBC
MSSNVPLQMMDVVLLAVSLVLLRQDVATPRNNEQDMQRETPPGAECLQAVLCSFHGGMNDTAAAHRPPRHGMGEFAHPSGRVA